MTAPAKQPDEFDAIRTVVETLDPFSADQQQRLLRWAQEKLGLAQPTPGNPPAHPATPTLQPHAPLSPAHGTTTDIRSFMAAKSPKSDNQFAAAVAYFYKFEAPEAQRKDTINKDDLVEACRMVQRRRPNHPAQVLVNTLAQGLLDKSERGQYRINSVGENLVAMVLPSQDSGGVKRPAKKAANKAPKKKVKKAKRSRA